MLRININLKIKHFVLVVLIFLNCLISVSGQSSTVLEIEKLFTVDMLQINNSSMEHLTTDALSNWVGLKAEIYQTNEGRNRNYTLIEQVKGIDNVTTSLHLGYISKINFEYRNKKMCSIIQSGSKNYSEVKQYGNQNRAEMIQRGYRNEINVAQYEKARHFINYSGSLQKVVIQQTGYQNHATITQFSYP